MISEDNNHVYLHHFYTRRTGSDSERMLTSMSLSLGIATGAKTKEGKGVKERKGKGKHSEEKRERKEGERHRDGGRQTKKERGTQ